MEFRILGPLEVVDGERVIEVSGMRARRLLTALALVPGEAQTAERLVDLVWPTAGPSNAANALQAQVSKLRRAVGDGLIVTRGGGYALDVDRSCVDARAFEIEVHRGAELVRAGRHAEAATALQAALARWRGAALADLDHPDVAVAAHRLEELRLVALEHRLEVDLAGGLHEEAIVELEALLERHPLRERLWGFRMLALYRAGRQAEALRVFQDARRVLADELGLEPLPELVDLEAAILARDPALDTGANGAAAHHGPHTGPRGDAAAEHGSLRRAGGEAFSGTSEAGSSGASATLGRRAGNLPADLTRFVGRERERSAVVAHLRANRLVTLVGPGGVGKTRLLLAAARQLSEAGDVGDGAWFVGLAPLRDPLGVAPTVADVLGAADLGDAATQRTVTSARTIERLAEFIGDRRLLVLLDNCEHVVAEASRIVDALLRACPQLTVAATSREGLGVPGEVLWPVPPLDPAEAVQLFAERAAGQRPGLDVGLDDERSRTQVEEICRRLDGLPLAIELAAARARVLPIADIAAALDDRFRLLTGGSRSVLPRQQTLRAVVDWSYDLLDDDERRAFERLSVFAGGCTLSAAAALLGTGGDEPDGADLLDSADLVGRLVDKSLVMPLRPPPRRHPASVGTEVHRYRMLQTLWHYGREKLAESADARAVRDCHLAWFRGLAETARPELYGPGQATWFARLRDEVENLRAAIDWAVASGDRDAALTIADACAWFWWLMGDLEEERLWLQAALAIPGPPSTVLAVRCRAWLGWCDAHVRGSGGLDEVLAARDDARRLGDPFTLGTVCLLGANISAFRGERELAEELGSEASAAMTVAGDVWGMGMAALLRAIVADLSGTAAEAAGHFERGIRLLEAGGDNCGLAIALSEYATQAERLGDYDAAWEALQRCRTLMAELDSPTFELTMVARLGTVALLQGRLDVAERYHELAVREIRRGGLRFTATMVLLARALSLRWTDRLAEARSTLEEAFSRLDEAQMPIGEAFCRSSLGFLAELEGRAEEAESWHRGALATAFGAGDRRGTALAIEGLAGAEALRGDGVRAAFMLGVADHLRRATGAPLPPGERRDVARIGSAARAAIGEASFEATFERGARVPPEGFVAGLLDLGESVRVVG